MDSTLYKTENNHIESIERNSIIVLLVKSEDNKRIIRYRKSQKGQKIQWPKEKGQKDRKYSGKKKKKKDERTENTVAKKKKKKDERTENTVAKKKKKRTKGQTMTHKDTS